MATTSAEHHIIHHSGDSTSSSAAAMARAAAAASAAAAAPSPPPPSRHLRAAAEALAAELTRIRLLADACSARGVLEELAIAVAAVSSVSGTPKWGGRRPRSGSNSSSGGGGKHDTTRFVLESVKAKKGRERVEMEAAAGRVQYIARRLEDDGKSTGGLQEKCGVSDEGDKCGVVGGDSDGSGRARGGIAPAFAPAFGGDPRELSTGSCQDSSMRKEGVLTGVDKEALAGLDEFRQEFIERVYEAGGLRALGLSWAGVAKLETKFTAWLREVRALRLPQPLCPSTFISSSEVYFIFTGLQMPRRPRRRERLCFLHRMLNAVALHPFAL